MKRMDRYKLLAILIFAGLITFCGLRAYYIVVAPDIVGSFWNPTLQMHEPIYRETPLFFKCLFFPFYMGVAWWDSPWYIFISPAIVISLYLYSIWFNSPSKSRG